MTAWPERFEPGGGRAKSHTELEHLERYRWAASRASGRILDAACGTGYGSALLLRVGEVTGVDYDDEALASARVRAPTAAIVKVKLPILPFADASFDYVVSFETVEHIDDAPRFIAEAGRVLAPTGSVLISTPNGNYDTGANPWHVREYSLPDFLALIRENGFTEIAICGQRTPPDVSGPVAAQATRVLARFPVLCCPGRWWDDRLHGSSTVVPHEGRGEPLFWVIAARKGP